MIIISCHHHDPNPTPKQYTEGGTGPQGITPHEKFAATKLVYHALCRLTALLDGAGKEALLPLEGPLVQVRACVRPRFAPTRRWPPRRV